MVQHSILNGDERHNQFSNEGEDEPAGDIFAIFDRQDYSRVRVEFCVWMTNAARSFCTVLPLGDVSADISCGLAVVVRITRFTQRMKE